MEFMTPAPSERKRRRHYRGTSVPCRDQILYLRSTLPPGPGSSHTIAHHRAAAPHGVTDCNEKQEQDPKSGPLPSMVTHTRTSAQDEDDQDNQRSRLTRFGWNKAYIVISIGGSVCAVRHMDSPDFTASLQSRSRGLGAFPDLNPDEVPGTPGLGGRAYWLGHRSAWSLAYRVRGPRRSLCAQ